MPIMLETVKSRDLPLPYPGFTYASPAPVPAPAPGFTHPRIHAVSRNCNLLVAKRQRFLPSSLSHARIVQFCIPYAYGMTIRVWYVPYAYGTYHTRITMYYVLIACHAC